MFHIALKHYTSKLSTYDDLTSLQTFGFRGEALSSLCALSKFHIVTARASDGPKGTRLDFEISGKIKGKSVVASQKGTIVAVEDLFRNLPVRRRELEKNIKREYGKVLGLLHAYSCISTGVRFSVSNQPAKGKKVIAFSTKSNPTTRENIANVYGAKTLLALLPLDLKLEMNPTVASIQGARNWATQVDSSARNVQIQGHISRPVVGEGRQSPDRQMFFVNSRPCALPQVAKAINEVYKGYNVTQSPFIFANLKMDTNAYDVNVSPDKRTILLHDQTALLEALKTSLLELFESHDQSVPQAVPLGTRKLPAFKVLNVNRDESNENEVSAIENENSMPKQTNGSKVAIPNMPSSIVTATSSQPMNSVTSLLQPFLTRDTEDRESVDRANSAATAAKRLHELAKAGIRNEGLAELHVEAPTESSRQPRVFLSHNLPKPVQDFNARLGVQTKDPRQLPASFVRASSLINETSSHMSESGKPADCQLEAEAGILTVTRTPRKAAPGVVQNAFDRMRPKRPPQETATITIGDQTTITTLGSLERKRRRVHTPKFDLNGRKLTQPGPLFVESIRSFAAPGTQMSVASSEGQVEEDDDMYNPKIVAGSSRKTIAASSMTTTTVDSDVLDLSNEPNEAPTNPALSLASDDISDDEYVDEPEKKTREEAKVAKMIALAEEAAARPTNDNVKRANAVLRGRVRKDSTLQLLQNINFYVARIEKTLTSLTKAMQEYAATALAISRTMSEETLANDGEERLSLTVSKADFGEMRVVGQFNLGFILAMRPATAATEPSNVHSARSRCNDELFIIDQHASDEKYNFERLQIETIVQNQRLVHPRTLELTAIEEEIILNYKDVLAKNGFLIETDLSGDKPVGQRCQLVSLPMSREVVFDTHDLEELIAMLNEGDGSSGGNVPRPSKVRKMFAMRACRGSIMVGKTLTHKHMQKVVRHMGEIDKPWNCPHGRPTMRHLFGMGGWSGWEEGDGLQGLGDKKTESTNWAHYVKVGKESGLLGELE
jgi:DNA mismatch repair protein PMS2